MEAHAYAVDGPEDKFHHFSFKRRNVGDDDVLIDILYSGICHSDIHQVRNEWHNSRYPLVPGHEIVGNVVQVGKNVKKFQVGDVGAVGCMVDSCRKCTFCEDYQAELFCTAGVAQTYNSYELDKKTPTYGGYSDKIVVQDRFVCKVPEKLKGKLANVAPVLCAGITTYSPLHRFKENVQKGKKVAIAGLGGLGHMGVKFAVAMGAEVTVFSTSSHKEEAAKQLGAHHFVNTKDENALKDKASTYDLILDTIAFEHNIQAYVNLVRPYGVVVLVGGVMKPFQVGAFSLIMGNKIVAGSGIGGMKETQEMLDFCAEKDITADIELIKIDQLEEAYERACRSDVKYRFVIDIQSLKDKVANQKN